MFTNSLSHTSNRQHSGSAGFHVGITGITGKRLGLGATSWIGSGIQIASQYRRIKSSVAQATYKAKVY
jgi:hypothetical protein